MSSLIEEISKDIQQIAAEPKSELMEAISVFHNGEVKSLPKNRLVLAADVALEAMSTAHRPAAQDRRTARKARPFEGCECGELTATVDPEQGIRIRQTDSGGNGHRIGWAELGLKYGSDYNSSAWSPAMKWFCGMAGRGKLAAEFSPQSGNAAKQAASRFNKKFMSLTGTKDKPLSKDGPLIRCAFGSVHLSRNERVTR